MWYGVDFDKTLVNESGKPVPLMVAKVKKALSEGKDVRIFTARLTGDDPEGSRDQIDSFCLEQFGKALPITNAKDYEMAEIWDDKAVSVSPNTGDTMPEMKSMGQLESVQKETVKKKKLKRPIPIKSSRKRRLFGV